MRYNDPVLSNSFTTANEIHIPVGRPVALTLRSMDVIHSFWVPKLHGKKDLIPGQVNTLYSRLTGPAFFAANAPSSAASSTRTWRCTWWLSRKASLRAGRRSSDSPRRSRAPMRSARTRRVHVEFLRALSCDCRHKCRRRNRAEPDPRCNSPQPCGWHCPTRTRISRVIDPQQHKPGNNMPPNPLSSEDLQALLSYLATLR